MNILRLFFIISLFFNLYANVEFTAYEKEWIKNNPVIKVGVDENWPPFDYVDNYGNHNGVSSDYLSIISAKTGLNFDIHSNVWTKVFDQAKNNELHMLACASKNKERMDYFKFTDSYIDVDTKYTGNLLTGRDLERAKKYERRLTSENSLVVSWLYDSKDWSASLSYFYQDSRNFDLTYQRYQLNVTKPFTISNVDFKASYYIQHNRELDTPLNYSNQIHSSANIYYAQIAVEF